MLLAEQGCRPAARGSVGRRWIVPILALLLVATTLTSATVGSVRIGWSDLFATILREVSGRSAVVPDEPHASVLFAIRLPRLALGVLVGAGLGVSGAAMQGVFRNPLVDPGLLGISSGAALGAAATIVLGAKVAHGLPLTAAPYILPAASFVAALGAVLVVERIARVGDRTAVGALLLAGIAVNALAFAQTGLLTYLANDAQLRTLTFWSLGSLGGATWATLRAVAIFCFVPLAILVRYARPLNALLLGEAEAKHLGFDVERTKRVVVVCTAILVGACVASSGIVGFVGLVVPHLVRLIVGPDHRAVLPSSALLGATLLTAADAIARTVVSPGELPLGIVTATVGAPFFVALLLRERRRLA